MFNIIIGTIILIVVLTWSYYRIQEALTGKPGPFSTVVYEDDGFVVYQEIFDYIQDPRGPTVVYKIPFESYNFPNVFQRALIAISENNPRLKIEVIP